MYFKLNDMLFQSLSLHVQVSGSEDQESIYNFFRIILLLGEKNQWKNEEHAETMHRGILNLRYGLSNENMAGRIVISSPRHIQDQTSKEKRQLTIENHCKSSCEKAQFMSQSANLDTSLKLSSSECRRETNILAMNTTLLL